MGDDNKELKNYTRIFNPILEALGRQYKNITSSEYALIMVIIRSTYGWKQKAHPFSTSLLAERTGMPERHVKRAVRSLITKGILIDYGIDKKTRCKVLGLNKKYSQWNGEGVQIVSDKSMPQGVTNQCQKRVTNQVKEGDNSDTQYRYISKDTVSKDNKSKDTSPKKTIFFSSTGIEYESIKDGYGIWRNEKGEVKWEPVNEGKQVEVDSDGDL